MKRILYFLILSIFILLTFHYLNKVFSTPHFYNKTIEDFKNLSKKEDIDVILYGSSHVFTAFNPLVLNREANIVSYNLGSDAQILPITNLVFEESLRHTTPKLVIVEINKSSLRYPKGEITKGHQLRALDFVSNWSISKLKVISDIYDSNEILGSCYPLIRNHQKWGELSFMDLNRADTVIEKQRFYYNGFLGKDNVLIKDREKYKDFRTLFSEPIEGDKKIKPQEYVNIQKFVSIAKKKGIVVLVITSPYLLANYYDADFFRELKLLCNEFEIPYLNLNDHYDEMNLDLNDFTDPGHLNNFGAFKASKFLANYIIENYSYQNESHSINNEELKKRNEFYNKFGDNQPSEFAIKIDACLSDKLCLGNFKISRRGNVYVTTFEWENNQLISENLKKYKLGVHIYPLESDIKLLSDYSQKKGFAFELVDFRLDENEESSYLNFNSKVRNIKQIKLFLYDADGYKGILGNSILIDNIIFGQNRNFEKKN